MEKARTLKLGDSFALDIKDKEDTISFDSYEILSSVDYKMNKCTTTECNIITETYYAPEGYKILKLEFSSDDLEAKNVIDFLLNYGTIDYKDTKNEDASMDMTIAVDKNYFGKDVYIKIPQEVEASEKIDFHFVIRDDVIIYQLI